VAKRSNVGTRVWLDQHDLSGVLNNTQLTVNQELPVVTCFHDTGPRRVVGNYEHEHSHAGFFDPSTTSLPSGSTSFDALTFALNNSTVDGHYLGRLFDSTVEGSIVYEAIVELSEQVRSGQVGEAVLLNFNAQGDGIMSRSTLVWSAGLAANSTGTGRNVGTTTSTETFQALIRVFGGTFTSFVATIQESQNDGGADPYAAITGMVSTVTVAGVTRLTSTAATETWKRVVFSAWSGTSATVAVTLGRVQF
jgi:hypothetical protein